jgi:hypothetical protein
MIHQAKPKRIARLLPGLATIIALAVLWSGCGDKAATTAAQPAKKSSSSRPTNAQPASSVGTNSTPHSVFLADKTAKDPFFPKSTRATEKPPVSTNQIVTPTVTAPADLVAALQSGFQGVIGAGEKRLAVINNIILEPDRTVSIPVTVGGRAQSVQVHCRQILKNGVVVDLQGQPQSITISAKPLK